MDALYWALAAAIVILIIIFVYKSFNKKEAATDRAVSHYTLYFTTWCPACKSMKPIWESVTGEIRKECADDAAIQKCPEFQEKDETKTHTEGIDKIPTIIRYYEDGSSLKYEGGQNRDSLKAFLMGA
jgi:thiol-disulfide isomerase/thioredoxin